MRIAFITNEFVIEKPDAGGLGNYLNRVTRLLHEKGHEVEIFVTRHKMNTPRLLDYNGIRVQHVPVNKGKIVQLIDFIDKKFVKAPYGGLAYNIGVPMSLARALENRHKETPFDLVQSSSVAFSGLFVKRKNEWVTMVRLSSIIENCMINDGVYNGIGAKLMVYLGRLSVKKADIIYSPSIFSTKNYKGLKGRKVHVVRPPFFLESQPVDISHYQLPLRYFIHFGSIGALKGSDIIAETLPLIWEKHPDFRMVWAGKERQKGVMQEYKKLWGDNAYKIIWFDGLVKNELYAVLKNAEVAVLPSRVDNLPNTVVESLFLGIPVIGSNGASIDELVEPQRNGSLIEIGNVKELAENIMDTWAKKSDWLPDGFQKTEVLNDFDPDIAVENIIRLYQDFVRTRY